MPRTKLSTAKSGDRCVVLDIASEPAELKSRLNSLGIIPGAGLELLRFAPPGNPMRVKVDGSVISIRKPDAASIPLDRQ